MPAFTRSEDMAQVREGCAHAKLTRFCPTSTKSAGVNIV